MYGTTAPRLPSLTPAVKKARAALVSLVLTRNVSGACVALASLASESVGVLDVGRVSRGYPTSGLTEGCVEVEAVKAVGMSTDSRAMVNVFARHDSGLF